MFGCGRKPPRCYIWPCTVILCTVLYMTYRRLTVRHHPDTTALLHTPQYCRDTEDARSQELDIVMRDYIGPDVAPDDPELIRLIQEFFLDQPRLYSTKFSLPVLQTPQAEAVDTILSNKSRGFFVECGALDGEHTSNTVWLETHRAWTGLLIEMDPSLYLQIRGKNRKSYSINACLSIDRYPSKMLFKEHSLHEGRLLTTADDKDSSTTLDTYCFPLYSLMLALNRTRIDYFSLDVEGLELSILKTIPFDKLDIAVFTVEYIHGQPEQEYIDFMATKGYTKAQRLNFSYHEIYLGGNDIVFVNYDLL